MISVLNIDGTTTSVRTSIDLAYVIQGDDDQGVIKIGRSRQPEKRVAGLVSGVPFNARLVAILNDGTRREKELKALLIEDRLRGEWYAPSEKINAYLCAARAENAILEKRTVSEAFFDAYIKSGILEYLNGRTPLNSAGGDFVYRLVHQGFVALAGRSVGLLEYCPHVFSPELLAGYVPLEIGVTTPAVKTAVSITHQMAGAV